MAQEDEEMKEIKSHEKFIKAFEVAMFIGTDKVFDRFKKIKYPAWGHGAVMLWQWEGEDMMSDSWRATLRNEKYSTVNKLTFKALTAKGALCELYAYCVYSGYLELL